MRNNSIRFQDCPKTFTRDQDKALTPEQTIDNFYERLEQFDIKILSEVKRIDNGRLDIPVYFSVCTDEARSLTGTKKQMGKGASPIQSKASACMELAERFSFFAFKADEKNFVRGDYSSLKDQGYPLLPSSYLLKSVEDTKLTDEKVELLLEGIPLQWTWATNISRGEQVLIPFSWFYAINEFNGPSAGNTIEEAALQGISEIVERHVCSLINQYQTETPAIDLATINDPVARDLLDKFEKNNIELYLNDFSLDTGMCSVGALAIDRSTFPQLSEIVYTAGTTPGPDKAIIRAITEVAQLAGDFNTGANYVASGLPKPLSMEEVRYLTKTGKKIAVAEMNDLGDDNMKVELERSIDALRAIDMEIFMIDVTHPRLRIPALYTIVPGAHFRERSRRRDAGLFAAKLLNELVEEPWLFEAKLQEMEQLLPESYYLSFYRGISDYNGGAPEEALASFDMALEQDPETEDLPYIYSYQGNCLKDLQRYDEAIEVLKRGCDEDDEREDLHNLLGFCYFKKEDYKTAISHFERAVHLNPASAMDYANLGVNHNRLGNSEEAIRFFTLALTLDPSIEFAQAQLEELSHGQEN
ncbi:MAG: YcaO-like family protein [Desulfofustis sp.]|nr:YcaO-like family protein [Desulfofustis sp.]MBT8355185.1 YcaO-like family protein [Desulfofustis sp.]